MKIKIWGTRGSLPTPGKDTVKYGGNTPCVEVRAGNKLIIIDAGTGIKALGDSLMKEGFKGRAYILISHTHWDHIHGFPFFTPIFIPGNEFKIFGPKNLATGETLKNLMEGQMKYSYFPVDTVELKSKISFNDIEKRDFSFGDVHITVHNLNHPVLCLGYRITFEDKVFVYASDNEPRYDITGLDDDGVSETIDILNRNFYNFCKNADAAFLDAQYNDEEYKQKQGWGHSSYAQAIKFAENSNVKKLYFFHHDPTHSDSFLDEQLEKYRKTKNNIYMAREEETIEL